MPKRPPLQREQDLAALARLYLTGKTQTEIGQAMGVSQVQISLDLKTLQARWQAAGLMDFDAAKARELARIDNLERVYWDEWEASRQEKETTQTRRRVAATVSDEAMVRKERRDGNPAYLAGIQWCIERRCKLLGLDAPTKNEVLWKMENLSDAEVLTVYALAKKAAESS
jgi:hypothetical protein